MKKNHKSAVGNFKLIFRISKAPVLGFLSGHGENMPPTNAERFRGRILPRHGGNIPSGYTDRFRGKIVSGYAGKT